MALLTQPLAPLLSPARHRAAYPPLLAAATTTPSAHISLFPHSHRHHDALCCPNGRPLRRRRRWGSAASIGQEESGASETTFADEEDPGPPVSSDAAGEDGVAASAEQAEASPEDLESIREIQRVCFCRLQPWLSRFASMELVLTDLVLDWLCQVLELLKKNRDMTFGEVSKLFYYLVCVLTHWN